MSPLSHTSPAALSGSQLLLWTGQRLHAGVPLYNMVLAFEIQSELDVELFRRAFRHLLESSDALRSRFEERDGTPQCVVSDSATDELQVLDFSEEPDPRGHFDAWAHERARVPLDVEARLVDAVLVKLSAERFVWYFAQHHLIADAWSTALCYTRLAAFYEALQSGREPDHGNYPAFSDYVRFEREQSESAALESTRAYWRDKGGAYGESAFYGNVPSQRSARTERVTCRLGATRSQLVAAAAMKLGGLTPQASRFQVFATALYALMYRVGGEHEDLAMLAPIHNRSTRAFKDTVGLFIEVLPMDVSIAADESFESLSRKVGAEYRDFLLHARPGSSSAGHARSCDVLLNYIPSTFGSFAGAPMQSEWIHCGHGDPAHSLRLQVHDFDASGEIVLHFDLNCDVFGAADRGAVARHFLALLDAYLEDPAKQLRSVDLVTNEERRAKTLTFNETERTWPSPTVLAAFAEQVAATPGDPALRCAGQTLRYAELDARANRLARHLEQRGVAPGAKVAVLLERSPEFVATILAILKSGAAYLPIEPTLPQGRIALLVEDSGSAAVVTDARLATRLPSDAPQTIVRIDDEAATIDALPATAPAASPRPDDLAYVIYTSGSTGRPKGVEISHRALANYAFWAREQYTAGAPTDFALFSPVSVDLTVTSLYVPLLSGGAIEVYPPENEEHDLTALRVLREDAVDVVKLTPAHLAMLLEGGALKTSRLRALIVGGEDLKRKLAQRVHDALGERVAIYNEYGPTEATVGCMIHRHDADRETGASVPIGRPIANARIYVLDAAMRPVPAGLPGEIWIGGTGLARGYAGDDAQTAASFAADPFVPGERIYRSGDLGREDPATGNLVYCGRIDDQVKIRGARVELAEVQASLERHPGVQECIVSLLEREAAANAGPAVDWASLSYCVRCGLASNHPDAQLDAAGVCLVCHEFDGYRDQARAYFRTREDLQAIFRGTRGEGEYDCLMLLSGGKDSTYALYQLVEMGLKVLVFSLDNGFISDSAKANIRRVVDHLGLELEFATTPSMNAIFADSLQRFSNVCQGCFKTIYTLATQLARERGIRHIVTGLSRGQIFETRLANFFRNGIHDPDEIDRMIVDARKAYHRVDDAVARQLDVSQFADDAIFDDIRFVDFYRYCDVPLEEVLHFIKERAAWTRPEDTGRSTNCLINDTGIFVHKAERGYHNYALPYSWDVRLGHKTRDECLDELNDEIDEERVERTLREVGFDLSRSSHSSADQRLVAYFVASSAAPSAGELREFLADQLPGYMIPSAFVALSAIPLKTNGKVDRSALPEPNDGAERASAGDYVAPSTETERVLARVWQDVLGLESVGIHDDFLSLGGDSILGIQVVSRARAAGLRLLPKQIFSHPTVAELARIAARPHAGEPQTDPAGEPDNDADGQGEPFPLTPIQHWFFAGDPAEPHEFAQTFVLEASAPLDVRALAAAANAVARHHGALRLEFHETDSGRVQSVVAADREPAAVHVVEHEAADDGALERAERELCEQFDLARGRLFGLALVRSTQGAERLVLAAHHLAVDALSWGVLLADFAQAYDALARGRPVELPPTSASWQRWVERTTAAAGAQSVRAELATWTSAVPTRAALPRDRTARGSGLRASSRTLSRGLTSGETAQLLGARDERNAAADELVLASLVQSVAAWTGAEQVDVDVEAHGRDNESDTSRTVGWFTSLYPLRLRAETDPAVTLRGVRERARAVARSGQGYGLLRYCGTSAERDALAAVRPPEILYNYLGRARELFAGSEHFRTARGLAVRWSPRAERTHLLEVWCALEGDELTVHFGYSDDVHQHETIETLAERTLDALRELMLSSEAPSPTDFPQADLSQSELDDILREFGD